jgi:hypothetical protein
MAATKTTRNTTPDSPVDFLKECRVVFKSGQPTFLIVCFKQIRIPENTRRSEFFLRRNNCLSGVESIFRPNIKSRRTYAFSGGSLESVFNSHFMASGSDKKFSASSPRFLATRMLNN